jgi:C4-dicarboxylate transporter DctM subunit
MSIGLFFIVFFVLLFVGTPIGVTFLGVSVLMKLYDPSFILTVDAMIRSTVGGLDSFPLLAIPMFMLSGVIMAKGGISEKIFNFFGYFLGDKTAGFPCAVVVTCLFYGAISGSGPATTAAVGSMTIPFLVGMGYELTFVTALVAISGGLGVIIPPSIPFIVYSSTTNASIADLFIAGILPGLLIGGCLMCYTYYYCRRYGEDKEKLQKRFEEIKSKGFLRLFINSFWALLTPVIILGSIYTGVASPTEAATVSIYYALAVSFFAYKTIKLRDLWSVFCEGVNTYGSVMLIMGTAITFSRVITVLGVGEHIRDNILSILGSKFMVLLVINGILLIAGMLLDALSAILILAPMMFPTIQVLGVDPIHFGIIMVVNLAIGFVTPPMGMNLFVASNLTKVPVVTIAGKALPFVAAFAIAVILINIFPQISLALIR